MGKHARTTTGTRIRPLPIRSTVRLRRPVDIWHKPALSAVVALAVPDFTLLALGRLDLVLYTSAGAMCALYAHGLPYAARARTLLWVVLGMVASLAVALTAASLTTYAPLLVLLAALIAAVHKMVCDATRIGPPGNLILTFITASAFFVPQRLGQVPFHVALALASGALAWLVCMAPALIRPRGPERIATARALEAAAALLRTEDGRDGPARHATAAAVNAAWHTVFLVPARTPAQAADRAGLELLLLRAESALAAPGTGGAEGADGTGGSYAYGYADAVADGDTHGVAYEHADGVAYGHAQDADRFLSWARDLRRGRPLPAVTGADAGGAARAAALAGVAAEQAAAHRPDHAMAHRAEQAMAHRPEQTAAHRPEDALQGGAWRLRRPGPDHPRGIRSVAARLAPGSPLLPIGARVAAGCALAGWASMAVGVGHPYWAVVTAAAIYQANTTLSWQRALQRTIGNLLGLLLFTALLPLFHTGQLAMVVLALAFQLGAEACISRNYWLGSVWVTPMALLLTEFGSHLPARTLVADRWIDTVVGAAVGLACCVLVTNRRATDRVEAALERVADAEGAAVRLLDTPLAEARELGWARDRLAACLVELREAVEVASGEWWQRALPEERVALAELAGHRTLSGLVRQLSAPALAA